MRVKLFWKNEPMKPGAFLGFNPTGRMRRILKLRCTRMRIRSPFREPVRVVMHLSGGFTRVSVIRTEGLGIADGGATWDIPTEAIPPHLRALGSQFLAVVPRFTPEDHDSPDDIRRMIEQVEIHELTDQDTFTGG